MTKRKPLKVVLRRLQELIKSNNLVPKKQWCMGVELDRDSCGTVGCSLGWAGTRPYFRKAGFKSDVEHFGVVRCGDNYWGNAVTQFAEIAGITRGQAERIYSARMNAEDESNYLATQGQVNNIIRQVIKEVKAEYKQLGLA